MTTAGTQYEQLVYEMPAPGVARIVMNRPERRNAQGIEMTYEIDDAFRRANLDKDISVIILAAAGDHFNAGHDVSGSGAVNPSPEQVVGLWGDYDGAGWEGSYAREKEIYLEITERWRNSPKPTIAEVQGSVISGGMMLVWACDLIMCSDDARFRDATAAEMGVPGAEFFQHPYEIGVRKAKEWLFTGGWLSAQEAERCGMVNHVVPREQLAARTLELARLVASNNSFTIKLAKQAINFAQDQMGRKATMDHAFHLHQIGHMQALLLHGFPVDITRLPEVVRKNIEKRIAASKAAGDAPSGAPAS